MKLLRLYKTFFRLNLMKDLAYRGNFFFGLALTSLEMLTVYIGIAVIFSHVDAIAGWSYGQSLVLLGVYMLGNSFAWLTFRAGVSDLDRAINKGDLDWYLVKPVDPLWLVTVQRIDIEDAARSLVGLVMIALGIKEGALASAQTLALNAAETTLNSGATYATLPTVTILPAFIIAFLAGQLVLFSIQLTLKTVSFKSIQGWATNSIAWRFQELAEYPTDIYRGLARAVYTFVVPLALIATVPAKVLTGALAWPWLLGSVALALLWFALARLIWLRALRAYSSASS